MQKTFIKKMLRFIALAAVLTLVIMFFMQSWVLRNNMESNAANMRVELGKKLAQNKIDIEEITQNANVEGLVKARAVASLIAADNNYLGNEAMQKAKTTLNIDGICVSDENGVLRWGTNYIGFDMNSADQSRPFMGALKDKGFELVQVPQLAGLTKKLSQFIGVARQDRPGIVQIELHPERLAKALEQNRIENLLSGFTVGSTGFLIAVRQSDGVVAAHKNTAWIGKTAQEAGLPEEKEGSGSVDIDGVDMFYSAGVCGDWIIYSVITSSELYNDRNILSMVFFIALLLIFGVLVYQIKQMLHTLILSGIDNLDIAVQRITAGDLNNPVDVRNTEEFERLSNGLNKMVRSIKDEMANTAKKAQETEMLLVAQRELLAKVKQSFEYVTSSSEKMNAISAQLRDGSGKQTNSINELAATMDEFGQAARDSAISAVEASKIALSTGVRMEQNKVEMARMLDAMREINETSAQIGHVIETVNSIAEQTNILAINASIEAARAGDAGRGFAVVAREVADLAEKSTDAVKETQNLIGNAQSKNEMGTKILQSLAQNFNEVIEGSKQSNTLMSGIGDAAAGAAAGMGEILEGVHSVSAIAEQTQLIAEESAEISSQLLDQAKEIEYTINNYR